MRSGLITVVYLVVGVIVAASHHYFQHADTLKPILSALLAVVLWPLLLLGINLHTQVAPAVVEGSTPIRGLGAAGIPPQARRDS